MDSMKSMFLLGRVGIIKAESGFQRRNLSRSLRQIPIIVSIPDIPCRRFFRRSKIGLRRMRMRKTVLQGKRLTGKLKNSTIHWRFSFAYNTPLL